MLFGARRKNGPHPLPIGSAFRAACALSGGTVNNHLTDGLLRPVVGRLDQGVGKEAKIRIAMFLETFGDILRRRFRWRATKYAAYPFPGLGQFSPVGLGMILGMVVEAKQLPYRRQRPYGITLGLRVGMAAEEAQFPNKMRLAELGLASALGQVGVIGGIVVAADNPGIFGAEHGGKNLGRAFPVDVEDGTLSGPEDPSPKTTPLLPMSGLVDIQDRFMAKVIDGLIIGSFQRARDALKRFGDFPPADRSLADLLHKRGQRGIGGMRLDVQKRQGGGQTIADKAFPSDLPGQFPPIEGATRRAIVGWRPKFPANDRIVAKINLLPHRIGYRMRMQTSSTAAGQERRLEYLDLIKLFRGEGRPEMRLMSRLAANTALPLATRRRRLDNVR